MSNLFGTGQGKTVATQAVRANGLQVQASSYGMGLSIVYGRARIPGTLIWYGDFQAVEHDQQVGKGGGGGTNVSYTYSSSFQLALCESDGTLTLGKIWKDSGLVSLSDINGTFGSGGANQAAWSHLGGAEALQYPYTAWIGCLNLKLGGAPNVPNFNFEINGLLQYNPAGGIYDAEPSAIITDLLTSVTHGISFAYLGDLTNFGDYCQANNVFLSPVIDQETTMADVLTNLLQITNSNTAWSNGKLIVIPYSDQAATGNGVTYTPPTTIRKYFTDKDYIGSGVRIDSKPLNDQPNVVRVEWIDPTSNYVTSVAEAKDEADIAASIVRQTETIQAHAITNGTLAQQTAQQILQRALYIRRTFTFTTTIENVALEAGDVVALSDSEAELSEEPVRVTQITEQEGDDLEFVCEEFPAGVAIGAIQSVEAAAGFVPNVNGAPDASQPPVIFRAPQFLVDGDVEIWIGLCGSGANWGGANILASFDNVTYTKIGSVRPGCRYGTLTAALADSSADPDTANSFSVALEGPGSLSGGTHAEADNLATLMLVDQELIAYSSTTLNGDGTYTLGNGYMRRQCYGTAHAAHAIGAPWIRVDDNIFRWKVDPSWVGATVYLKFQAWNLYGGGLESEASLAATTYVIGTAEEIPDTPPTPTNTNAYGAANGIHISWENPNPAAVAITSVEYSPDGTTWSVLGQVQGTHYVHTFSGNTTYWYRLRARSSKFLWSGYTAGFNALGGSLDAVHQGDTNFWVSAVDGANRALIDWSSDGHINGVGSLVATGTCKVSASGTVVSKPTGSTAWDSCANGTQAFSNGAFIAWRTGSASSATAAGLSSNPTADNSYTSIDYALSVQAGTLFVEESGVDVGSFGSYTNGDALEVRYDGVTVRYFHKGAQIRAVRAVGKALYPKAAVATVGGSISNISFGPVTSISQTQGSYLDNISWVIGASGSQGNYTDQADTTLVLPSTVILGKGPYGTTEPLWVAYGAATSAGDGGWVNTGDLYGIDPTKTYRASVWVYVPGSVTVNGNLYLGCDQSYTDDLSGTQDTNPYFVVYAAGGLTKGKWYLFVGVIHGSSYSGSGLGVSGIYDPATGKLIFEGTEFKNMAGAPRQTHRAFLFYDTAGADKTTDNGVYFAKPRFEEMNGNEPSIQTLLAPAYGALAFANNLDDVPDGPTYARIRATELSGGKLVTTYIQDTRATNELPSWYRSTYPNRTVTEFKDTSALGLSGTGGYVALHTSIPWTDTSGAPIVQFVNGSGGVWMRKGSADDTAWGAWYLSYDNQNKPGLDADVLDGETYGKTLQAYLSSGRPWVFKGAYASGTTYNQGDEVSYESNYYLYTNATSTSGHAPTNTAYWALVGPADLDALADGNIFARSQQYQFGNNTGTSQWMHVGTLVLNVASSATLRWSAGQGYNAGANQQSITTCTIRSGNGAGGAPNISGISAWEEGGTTSLQNALNGAASSVALVATGNSISQANTSWEVYFNCSSFTLGPLEVTVNRAAGDSFTFSGVAATPDTSVSGAYVEVLGIGRADSTGAIVTRGISSDAASQIISSTLASAGPFNFHNAAISGDVLTASITSTGFPIGVDVTFGATVELENVGMNSPSTIYITRDGAQVGLVTFDAYSWVLSSTPQGSPLRVWTVTETLTLMDTPGAGSHTYALHYDFSGSTAGSGTVAAYLSFNNVSLKVREYKR